MSIIIHLPTWWPWALGCVGCLIVGFIAGVLVTSGAISSAIMRGLGW